MEKNSHLNYGEKLKNARKNKGLTQLQMASLLNISTATIKDMENKNHIPITATLVALEKLFPELKDIFKELILLKNKKRVSGENYKNSKKNDRENDFKLLLDLKDKIEKLELENKMLKESKKSENSKEIYFENRKTGSFRSDIENRTLLITKMWKFNDEMAKMWGEVGFLIDILDINELQKMGKGLNSIADNLEKISKEIRRKIQKKNSCDEIIEI